MNQRPETRAATGLSPLLALMTLAISAAALVGWATHIERLKSILPGYITMKANTSIGLILLALPILLLSLPRLRKEATDPAATTARRLAGVCAILAAAI